MIFSKRFSLKRTVNWPIISYNCLITFLYDEIISAIFNCFGNISLRLIIIVKIKKNVQSLDNHHAVKLEWRNSRITWLKKTVSNRHFHSA